MDTDKVKRILVIRTDRLGDVLLNVPAVRALRQRFPESHISIMVQPKLKELVSGNPDIDEVIPYDKNGSQKGWLKTLGLIWLLRRKRFDISVTLNPAKRSNIITFLAGIPIRVGYDRKWGFLLTHKIKDEKYKGEKHEIEYNLDLVRNTLGADTKDTSLFVPITEDDELYVSNLLQEQGVPSNEKLIAIHPWSSCPSKIWPIQRYIQVANILKETYGINVAVVGEQQYANSLYLQNATGIINLCGKLTLRQLAALFKHSNCLISNDSGPVHIACAVGTSCVVIFGRVLSGVSHKRWGPYGNGHIVLQKDAGCAICEPQDCKYGYKCLLAVTVEDVLDSVNKILAVKL